MLNIFRHLDWTVLTDILYSVIPAIICVTLHELAHGYTAYRLGDPTAKRMGRLTLNPLKHIDVFGFLMMVVFKFGWAKPVPVDMRYFKNPKRGMAITAIAGPGMNLAIGIVALFLYGFLTPFLYGSSFGSAVLEIVFMTAYISIALMIFNIIPIPPLDGSKVLFSMASNETYWKLMRYERYGMILLFILVASGVLGAPLGRVVRFVFDKLTFFYHAGFDLSLKLF